MKSTIVFAVFLFTALALSNGELYSDRYDNIDIEEILTNKKLFLGHIKCVLDQGKCTPEGKELKSHIKEAMENDCAKCTEAQKKGTRRVLGHLINKETEYWNELCAKYDPEHKYAGKYEKELRE